MIKIDYNANELFSITQPIIIVLGNESRIGKTGIALTLYQELRGYTFVDGDYAKPTSLKQEYPQGTIRIKSADNLFSFVTDIAKKGGNYIIDTPPLPRLLQDLGSEGRLNGILFNSNVKVIELQAEEDITFLDPKLSRIAVWVEKEPKGPENKAITFGAIQAIIEEMAQFAFENYLADFNESTRRDYRDLLEDFTVSPPALEDDDIFYDTKNFELYDEAIYTEKYTAFCYGCYQSNDHMHIMYTRTYLVCRGDEIVETIRIGLDADWCACGDKGGFYSLL